MNCCGQKLKKLFSCFKFSSNKINFNKKNKEKFTFDVYKWLRSYFIKDSYKEYKNAVNRIIEKIDLFYLITKL